MNKQIILHPLVFAAYPAIFAYVENRIVIDFNEVVLPMALTVFAAGLIWTALTRAIGDKDRAAVFTSVGVMSFFSFGHLERVLSSPGSDGEGAWFWPVVVTILLLVVMGCLYVALKRPEMLGQVGYMLNLISLFLMTAPLFHAAMWNWRASELRTALPDTTRFDGVTVAQPAPNEVHDIYYFILDGYGRADRLQERFGFDNSEFVKALESRGFNVADHATSNYPVTAASVTSTMNFAYLDQIVGNDLKDVEDRRFLRERMRPSRAVTLLKQAGYRIVTFESPYTEVHLGGADVVLKRWWFFTPYVRCILQMTPLSWVAKLVGGPDFFDEHRKRALYPFDHIDDAIAVPGPKLVFTHVLFAHPPFVFQKDGSAAESQGFYTWEDGDKLQAEIDRAAYGKAYTNQVAYLNGRFIEALDRILEKSENDPIIIVHGDHGSGSGYSLEDLADTDVEERYSILWAARLPGETDHGEYESVSVVNTWRIVFDRYFGGDFPLLENRSFFVPFLRLYDFQPINGFPDERLSRADYGR